MTITFVILAVTIGLFIWGKLRADIVALLSMLALYFTGVISVNQALSGFADSAVIMIAVLFVVGEGLTHTGITSWLGARMMTLSHGRSKPLLLWMMGFGAAVSGFMSNTAATAALMPAVVAAAWGVGSVPAKFLMPLSFAAITGGLLTLMGTPPNVVVSETLTHGGFAPFGFFDFASGRSAARLCGPDLHGHPGPTVAARPHNRAKTAGLEHDSGRVSRCLFAPRQTVPAAGTSHVTHSQQDPCRSGIGA